MQSIASMSAERAEVEAVLQSGAFSRAPNLIKILRYSCDRYFEGQGDQIKEYNVAVEALGRPSDFDQKKDSIVRVEAHKLRRRLKEFYETEGAGHLIRIEIPNGQYAPVFIHNGHAAESSIGTEVAVPAAASPDMPAAQAPSNGAGGYDHRPSRRTRRFRTWIAAAALIAVCAVALGVGLRFTRMSFAESKGEVWTGSPVEVPSEFRTLAGYHGPPFQDRQGRTWQADAFYSGGRSIPLPASARFDCLPDPRFVHALRQGDFRYDIPVRAGTYELHLYFVGTPGVEPPGEDAGRSFMVDVNGKPVLSGVDLLSDAGGSNRLYERVFRDISRDRDGKIHIGFHPVDGPALLTAMEILADTPGHVRPIRIVARKSSLIDTGGTVWSADRYALGGRLVERKDSVRETMDKTLFEGERYGNFTYYIPAAPGLYQLTLYFAETFFGSRLPFADQISENGARIFNVFVNGEAVLRDFEIAKEAGGSNRGIKRTFNGVQPNAQGKIVIEFNSVRNYAEVNALELVGMDNPYDRAKLTVR
jgi:hypothetical protein